MINKNSAIKLALGYFLISSLYIIFSDKLVLQTLADKVPVDFLSRIQSFKGLIFVLLTSLVLFLIVRRDNRRNSEILSEQKITELLLLDNQARYIKAQQLGKVGNWEFNIQKGTFWASVETKRMFGFRPEDGEFTVDYVESCIPERERVHQALVDILQKGKEYDITYEVHPKDGTNPITVNSIAEMQLDEQGNPFKLNGIILDITSQRQKEELIRQSESILSVSQKIAKVGGWQWDVEKKKMFWTDETYRIHDFEKVDFESDSEEYISMGLNCYSPEDREAIANSFYRCAETGEKYELIFPFTTLKGRNLWIRTSAEATWDGDKITKVTGVIQDITEIKLAEKAIRESEKRFRDLVNSLNSGIVVHAPDTSILFNNPKAAELLGLNNDQLLGKQAIDPEWNFLHEDNKPFSVDELPVNKIISRKSPIVNTTVGVIQPGTKNIVWLLVNGFPVMNSENGIKEIIISFIDITEQKNATTELVKSEEKYRLIAENTHDVISLHDKDARYLYVSPSIKTIRGFKPDELIGKNPYEFIHPDDIPLITKEEQIKKLETGQSYMVVYRFRFKDGKYGWFESIRHPIFNDNKEIIKIVAVSRDITERIEKERDILNYQKLLETLTIEISLVEEKQRRHIAENIHDHLSQSLVISKMKLNDLQKEIHNQIFKGELKLVLDHISNALENSRKITYDLSPPVLYELGLIETIYWLAEKTELDHKISVSFTTDVDKIELTDSKLILIYRVIQELINNTIKHAKAENINISFNMVQQGFEIVYSDNGIGFENPDWANLKSDTGGFGLFAVKERIKNLNGTIVIHSEKNRGTEVKIYLPLDS